MRTPDFDDTVFENRNKDYGAFVLRKRYKRVIISSVLAAVLLSSFMVLIPFIKTSQHENDKVYEARYVTLESLKPPKDEITVTPPPPPPPPKGLDIESFMGKSVKYVVPVIVDSIVPMENKKEQENGSHSDSTGRHGSITGSSFGINSGDALGNGVEGGIGAGDLYSSVEVMPLFKGGDIEKFREWVLQKTKYPELAMVNNIQGIVYISFIVERDGTVSNVKVVKGVDPLIDNEAKKTVESSPKWTPGRQSGKAVRVTYLIPLNFRL
jgi:protein TonB